ncbi:hypothetical protein BC939DRAFT_450849 [Gamsiella multidivaricata]|uniref:uncharacterized protein n=1 Tax=Gamsiella multidivaricata TaxID=101098 RepID=UPI00221F7F74|nr:uncharacterized protein BC939DRAFT_450849 [Gamsiella multidivaricata]KAG0367191.1 hypothetical protein BGZ54_004273 [Gamsiella multidivaricata]KAI7823799.1 hypothetical protein BC939DRAFT_450849 [Gamsiella multidivaricata]
MPSFFVRALKLNRFQPNRIVTSHLVSPMTLAIVRGIEFLYTFVTSIIVWATTKAAVDYFQYFTHLSYFGLMAYLFASTVWSTLYLRRPESERAKWLRSGSPWWGYTHWLFYSTVVTYAVVIPIVFWSYLAWDRASWTRMEYFRNISVHALNGVFGAVVELILNRHFLLPVHSLFVAAVMILYMLMTFLVFAGQGTWVYPFLDWSQGPIAAAYYFIVAAGLFVIYFILYFLHKYRNKWLAKRSIKVNGDLDKEYEGRDQDDEKEMEEGEGSENAV